LHTYTHGVCTIQADPLWIDLLLADLQTNFSRVQPEARQVVRGRGPSFFYRPKGSESRVFVRKYRHGGLCKFAGDLYFSPNRVHSEVAGLEAARRAGVLVPDVAGARTDRWGPFVRMTLVTRELEGCVELGAAMKDGRVGDLWPTLAQVLRRLHEAGV
jgi:hypothetical protein